MFCERLKMYRKKSGLTQQEVAIAIGVSLRGYQQYEQGKFEPNIEKLLKLSKTLNTSLDDLLGADLPQ